jgi:hypothetical protein
MKKELLACKRDDSIFNYREKSYDWQIALAYDFAELKSLYLAATTLMKCTLKMYKLLGA